MKLNKKHFDLFKKECKKYIEKFGLCSWEINYKFKPIEGAYGNCASKYSGRAATITLSSNFYENGKNVNKEIKRIALHECLELLISPLEAHAQARVWDADDFDKEIHIVIRTLEKLL